MPEIALPATADALLAPLPMPAMVPGGGASAPSTQQPYTALYSVLPEVSGARHAAATTTRSLLQQPQQPGPGAPCVCAHSVCPCLVQSEGVRRGECMAHDMPALFCKRLSGLAGRTATCQVLRGPQRRQQALGWR